MRGARRSSTTACASSDPATCRRPEASSAPSTAPGSWPSSTSPSPVREIPVGWGETRRGYVVTCKVPYSRTFADALILSRAFSDLAGEWAAALPGSGPFRGRPDESVRNGDCLGHGSVSRLCDRGFRRRRSRDIPLLTHSGGSTGRWLFNG
jgi:hypothetical protein